MTDLAYDIPALEDLYAVLAERSLYEFVKVSWPVLHPAEEFSDGWHLAAMAEHIEAVINGEIENLLINIAPRTSKSTLVSIDLPAWTWGPHNDPGLSFMYTSFAIHLASDHSTKCRRLIESDWYQRYWGERFQLLPDENQKTKYANDHQGVRASFGMGGVAGQGGHVIVVDDPNDTKDWLSPTKMKTAIETYDSAIHNRVNDPNNPKRIVVAQRISDLDLSNHLLKSHQWEHLVLPTEYDPKRSKVTSIGWKDPRTRVGELLAPNRYNRLQVDTEKKLRPRIFNAQHQQNPTTDETAIFKRDRWKHYLEDPREVVDRMQSVIISVDAAFKDKASSSMVAIEVWGKLGANKFLLDRDTDHYDFVATCRQIAAMSRKWPQARAKLIEDKANGPAIINALKNEIAGIIPWPPEGQKMDSKEARAYAIQPEHEAGNLFLPNREMIPWTEEFIEICASFPNGEYDDDIDSMTQAIMYLDKMPSAGAVPTGVGTAFGWLR